MVPANATFQHCQPMPVSKGASLVYHSPLPRILQMTDMALVKICLLLSSSNQIMRVSGGSKQQRCQLRWRRPNDGLGGGGGGSTEGGLKPHPSSLLSDTGGSGAKSGGACAGPSAPRSLFSAPFAPLRTTRATEPSTLFNSHNNILNPSQTCAWCTRFSARPGA